MIHIVDAENSGLRVDKYITVKLGEGYSRTYVRFLMDNGCVSVNGKAVKMHYALHEGDEVEARLLDPPGVDDVEPENIPLDILYEDEWIVVVNKPAGMVVHPGAGNKNGTLVSALLYHCGSLPETDNKLRPGIVHRLDKDTSGVIVAAKNAKALRSLSKQFQNRTVKKRYIALVKGCVQMDNGCIEAPLARHAEDRKKVEVDHANGKAARTVYHVIRRSDKFTLLRLEPETGRTHQIRVHMKHIGHPVLGDVTYGGKDGKMARQALHAESLGFTHPGTGKYVEFTIPMPEDIRKVAEALDDSR
ncbi:MAG: RluA family pseudouridine synthase [Candidatus Omnitrophota bacterium]